MNFNLSVNMSGFCSVTFVCVNFSKNFYFCKIIYEKRETFTGNNHYTVWDLLLIWITWKSPTVRYIVCVTVYVYWAKIVLRFCDITWFITWITWSITHIQVVKQAQEDIRRVMEILNNVLATRTFLVGERVTLADITVACNLLLAYKQVLYLV